MLKVHLMNLALSFALLSGCSPMKGQLTDEELAAQWQDLTIENGSQLNGVKLNGVKLNGVKLNGVKLNGVQISGTTISGTREDTAISVSAADLNNSDMDSEDEFGDVIPLKVDSVFWNASAGKNLYNLKHYNEDTGSYEWVCGTDTSGNPIASIPIQKSYLIATGDDDGDPSNFTMACINAALGKCVMWGYQVYNQSYPETYSGTTKYRDLGVSHQACQRMVRADYCGNGTPHTANGTPIDVYDTYGIQTPDNLAGNSLEAEWRPDGAHCIQHTRWGTADSATTAGLTDLQYVQTYCPGRLAVNEAGCNNDSASSFYKNNGFGLTDQKQRSILRNQSYQH